MAKYRDMKIKLKGVKKVMRLLNRLEKVANKTAKAIERFSEAYNNVPELKEMTINLEVNYDK